MSSDCTTRALRSSLPHTHSAWPHRDRRAFRLLPEIIGAGGLGRCSRLWRGWVVGLSETADQHPSLQSSVRGSELREGGERASVVSARASSASRLDDDQRLAYAIGLCSTHYERRQRVRAPRRPDLDGSRPHVRDWVPRSARDATGALLRCRPGAGHQARLPWKPAAGAARLCRSQRGRSQPPSNTARGHAREARLPGLRRLKCAALRRKAASAGRPLGRFFR